MNQIFSQELLQRCAELALQVTLWTTFGVAILVLLRKQAPWLLKQLGIGVMIGVVVLTAANLIIAPWWHIGSWFTAPKPMINDHTSINIPTTPDANHLSTTHWHLTTSTPSGVTYSASTSPLSSEPNLPWPWKEWLILACMVLSAMLFLRLAIGLWQLHRLRQSAWIVREKKLHHTMATLQRHFEVPGIVEVRELTDLPGPLTFGYRRPVILLPSSWRTWTDEELRCVLAHEIGHVAAHDFLTYLLLNVTRALHGYHPLVHWLYGRVVSLLEIQTDVAAARCVGQELYIRAVCELVLKFPSDKRSRMIAPSLGFGPLIPLSRRMSMLTMPHWSRPSKLMLTALVTLLPAALVLLLGLRAPTQADDAANTKQQGNTHVAQTIKYSPYVLDYLPTDAKMVICGRPAQFAALPGNYLISMFNTELHGLLAGLEFSLPSVQLQDVDQLVAVDENSLSLVKLLPGKRWQEVFAKDQPSLKGEAVSGKVMYVLPNNPGQLGSLIEALGLVDEQTLIFGSKAFVETCLAGKHVSPRFRWSIDDWKEVESGWIVMAMDIQGMVASARAQREPYHDPETVKKMIEASKSMDYVFFAGYPGEQVDIRMLALRAPGKLAFNDTVDNWCREFYRSILKNPPRALRKSISEPICDTVRAAGQTMEVDRVMYRLNHSMGYSACFAAMQEEEKKRKQEMKAEADHHARQVEIAQALAVEIPVGWMPVELPIQPWVKDKNVKFLETKIYQMTMPMDMAQALSVKLESGLQSIDHMQLFQLSEAVQGDVRANALHHPRILHTGQFTMARTLPMYDLKGSATEPIRPAALTMKVSCHDAQWRCECGFSQKVSELLTNSITAITTTMGENILVYTQKYKQKEKDFLFVTVIETKDADHVVVSDPEPKLFMKSWHLRVAPQAVEKLKTNWKEGMSSSHEIAIMPEATFFDAVKDWQNDKDFSLLVTPMVMSKFESQSQVDHGKPWEDLSAIRQQVWGKLINDRIRLNGVVLTMLDSGEKLDGKPKLAGFPVQFENRVKPGECLLIRWTDEKGRYRIVAFCPNVVVQLGNKQSKE